MQRERSSRWCRLLAAGALPLAALTALGYGVWGMTARRGIFTDLAAGRDVSAAAARESDRLHQTLFWTAVGALALAAVLWLLAHVLLRKPLGIPGFTGLVLFGTGAAVAAGGGDVASLVTGGSSDADTTALGFLVLGGGFVLLAGGAVAALVALFARPPRPDTPTAGFAGWEPRW